MIRGTKRIAGAICIALSVVTVAYAAKYSGPSGQLGNKTSYSVGQLQEMLNNAPGYDPSTMSYYANTLKFESGGNTGIVNQYGMAGLGQLSPSNINNYYPGMTPAQFANLSAQDQVNVMVKYTNAAMQDSTVKKLQEMQANGQTLGGKPIDSATLLACTQFGHKVCKAAIESNCASGADGNGIGICEMADKIRGVAGGSEDPTDPNYANTALNNIGMINQSDISAAQCWACNVVAYSFNIVGPIFSTVPAQLADNMLIGFAAIFALYMVFKVAENFFFPISYNQPHIIIGLWIKFTVVMSIIMLDNLFNGIIMEYAMAPAIGAGGSIGTAIAEKAVSIFGG